MRSWGFTCYKYFHTHSLWPISSSLWYSEFFLKMLKWALTFNSCSSLYQISLRSTFMGKLKTVWINTKIIIIYKRRQLKNKQKNDNIWVSTKLMFGGQNMRYNSNPRKLKRSNSHSTWILILGWKQTIYTRFHVYPLQLLHLYLSPCQSILSNITDFLVYSHFPHKVSLS